MTLSRSTVTLFFLATIVTALAVGILMQGVSFRSFIFMIGITLAWSSALFAGRFSLQNCLMLISTFFLFPNHFVYYVIWGVLSLCLIVLFVNQRRFFIPLPAWFLVLLIFGILALSKTYVNQGFIYFTSTIVVPFLTFITITNLSVRDSDLTAWMKSIVLVATIVAIYGILIALLNPGKRIGSTWSTAMTINGFYTVAFFFAIGLGLKFKHKLVKIAWFSAGILVFLGMLFTYTRIAMVAVMFGLLLIFVKYKKARLWSIVTIAIIPLVIPTAMMSRGDVGRFLDLSIVIRLIAWYNSLNLIRQNPLTGIGFSTWSDIYKGIVPMRFLYAQHSHNVYINLALEMGLVGTVAYIWIVFSVIKRFYLKIRTTHAIEHYCVLIALLSLLVSCMTDIFIQQYQISILFWITLALIYSLSRDIPIPMNV